MFDHLLTKVSTTERRRVTAGYRHFVTKNWSHLQAVQEENGTAWLKRGETSTTPWWKPEMLFSATFRVTCHWNLSWTKVSSCSLLEGLFP